MTEIKRVSRIDIDEDALTFAQHAMLRVLDALKASAENLDLKKSPNIQGLIHLKELLLNHGIPESDARKIVSGTKLDLDPSYDVETPFIKYALQIVADNLAQIYHYLYPHFGSDTVAAIVQSQQIYLEIKE